MSEYDNMLFAEFIANTDVVKFGDFILKSGKKSNIFFNFGNIVQGNELIQLGNFFADYIVANSLDKVDVLFGPAYKGINITLATSIALFEKYTIRIPFAYNRKTEKTHAEGGKFVGYDLSKAKTALVLDDIITDGGTKYEAIDMLSSFPNLIIKAFIVGIDREEKDLDGKSCRTTFIEKTGINLLALTTKSEVLKFRKQDVL